jgi:hypothetical protein
MTLSGMRRSHFASEFHHGKTHERTKRGVPPATWHERLRAVKVSAFAHVLQAIYAVADVV